MTLISLETHIQAPAERCFDLSLSVDLHQISTAETGEKAVDGIISGLMQLHDTVTWRAKHLGIWQELTTQITAWERPFYFQDQMLKGAFKSMVHDHIFEEKNKITFMKDVFVFESPLGILGNLADSLFLKKYMTHFLLLRNRTIKQTAESEEWRKILE
jgi:ligand-binding SRPBCC domain-containing protein